MIKLNLGRNCLRYLIRLFSLKEIYIPYYACDVIRKSCRKEGCIVRFYHIGKDFLPIENMPLDKFILYINYFGLCDKNCKILKEKYPNLIIDNTQAFYSKCRGVASFNSLRKFFDVQNGAYLYIDKTLDTKFDRDDLSFIPVSMQENYIKFVENELLLNNQDIKLISDNVDEKMKNIDFETDKKQRLDLFRKFHNKYGKFNLIKLAPSEEEVPYCYPLCTNNIDIQKQISDKNIPLLRLWEDIPKEFIEHEFLNNTVALPLIDKYL